ncbi:hypothetical protein Bca4012_012481 [Brassica carinata]
MESNGQRLYSVLTRAEVLDKMMKEIVQISEVFSVSRSDATVALIRLGWDSFRASDLLGDDKDKFLSELGLVSNRTDGDGDIDLVSTPLCSHKFCSDCWRDHLEKKKDEKTWMMISCVASVGADTIEKLSEPVNEMYERYVLGSFMESNKIKWCPAKGCEYAIERDHEDPSEEDGDGDDDREASDFGVVCLCGHTFCWRCKLESHRPVTCNNASLWLNDLLDEARRLTSLTTKPCPHCNINVRRSSNVEWRIITCVCRNAFCWRCLLPEEYHRRVERCFEVFVPTPHDEAALDRHLTLWEKSLKAVERAKRDLEAIERDSIPVLTQRCGLGELDMRAVREACMLIVQCRLVLKWSSVFGYFVTDYHSARKQYLEHLVEGATANLVKHKEALDELVRGVISGEGITGFRHKLETSTTATGNYFHVFVKTVEEGLRDVKAGVFENVPTDYWFCDRCTFQNDAFERKCRICVFPFEGPSPPLVALGNNNGTAIAAHQELPDVSSNPSASPPLFSFGTNNVGASAHQQQAPDMSNNPFAGLGGTNTASAAHQQGVPNMSNNPFAGLGGTNTASAAHQQGVPNMSNNPFAGLGGTNVFETAPFVAFGDSNGAHGQQVPDMSNNPFAFGNNSIGASARQPSIANNSFASSRAGPILPVYRAFGNSRGRAQVPNMADNPFARPGGTNPLQSPPPPFVAFGSNNNGSASGAHQQQAAPNSAQGGTKALKFD